MMAFCVFEPVLLFLVLCFLFFAYTTNVDMRLPRHAVFFALIPTISLCLLFVVLLHHLLAPSVHSFLHHTPRSHTDADDLFLVCTNKWVEMKPNNQDVPYLFRNIAHEHSSSSSSMDTHNSNSSKGSKLSLAGQSAGGSTRPVTRTPYNQVVFQLNYVTVSKLLPLISTLHGLQVRECLWCVCVFVPVCVCSSEEVCVYSLCILSLFSLPQV